MLGNRFYTSCVIIKHSISFFILLHYDYVISSIIFSRDIIRITVEIVSTISSIIFMKDS